MTRSLEDWLLTNLVEFKKYASSAEDSANVHGLLQQVDPRVKIVGALALILSAVAAKNLGAILWILGLSIALAAASKLRLDRLAHWVWRPVLLFSGPIALPALFLTPGNVLAWPVSLQGLRAAAFLVLRAETTTTISILVALTTPWTRILKTLRALGVPTVFVAILSSTYRYMFLLLQTASDMSDARRSRTVWKLSAIEKRRIAGAAIGVLLSKSFQLSSEVHQAMLARGFRGEFYVLDDFRLRAADWLWLGVLSGFVAAIMYLEK